MDQEVPATEFLAKLRETDKDMNLDLSQWLMQDATLEGVSFS